MSTNMISAEVETRALRFLLEDEFCSVFELATIVALWDADAGATPALIAEWERQGWAEVLSQDDPELPDLVHLTEAGCAEAERRRASS
jgi:hypothetical protein